MQGRRILLLNLFLLAGTMLCAYQIHQSWRSFEETQPVKRMIVTALDDAGEVHYDSKFVVTSEKLEHDFFEVYERDLFSPLRRPSSEGEGEEAAEAAPEFPMRPQMNGTSTIGGQLSAFLTVFPSAKAQGETKVVSIGDQIQGYQVAEITDTTVSLKWKDVVEVIDMADNKPIQTAQKGQRKLAAVNIIRIGSALAVVETNTSEEAKGKGEETRGLQIGIVRGQTSRTGAGRQGLQGGAAGRMQGTGNSRLGRGIGGSSRGNLGTGGSRNLPGNRRLPY